MSYTNLPSPDSGLPWRVGVHRLFYEDGRFRLDPTSGRVVSPDGTKDKDAVIFNLRGGRIGLIQDSPEHPARDLPVARGVVGPARGLVGNAHARLRGAHTDPPSGGRPRGSAPAHPRLRRRPACCCSFTNGKPTIATQPRSRCSMTRPAACGKLLPDPIVSGAELGAVGDVDNIIFVQGAATQPDGTIYLSCGAADRCVGARGHERGSEGAGIRLTISSVGKNSDPNDAEEIHGVALVAVLAQSLLPFSSPEVSNSVREPHRRPRRRRPEAPLVRFSRASALA
jgi:hypothetical protein